MFILPLLVSHEHAVREVERCRSFIVVALRLLPVGRSSVDHTDLHERLITCRRRRWGRSFQGLQGIGVPNTEIPLVSLCGGLIHCGNGIDSSRKVVNWARGQLGQCDAVPTCKMGNIQTLLMCVSQYVDNSLCRMLRSFECSCSTIERCNFCCDALRESAQVKWLSAQRTLSRLRMAGFDQRCRRLLEAQSKLVGLPISQDELVPNDHGIKRYRLISDGPNCR